jgi:hypothetical protein
MCIWSLGRSEVSKWQNGGKRINNVFMNFNGMLPTAHDKQGKLKSNTWKEFEMNNQEDITQYLTKQIAQSIINNHLSLIFLLHVLTSTRSSSGWNTQKNTSTANLSTHFFDKFGVLVCLCIFLPYDDLVEVERCNRNMTNDYLLLIVQFVESNTV